MALAAGAAQECICWRRPQALDPIELGAGDRRCKNAERGCGAGNRRCERNTRFGADRRRWWSRTLALALGAALSAGARRWVGAVLVGAGLALAGRVGAGLALAD